MRSESILTDVFEFRNLESQESSVEVEKRKKMAKLNINYRPK